MLGISQSAENVFDGVLVDTWRRQIDRRAEGNDHLVDCRRKTVQQREHMVVSVGFSQERVPHESDRSGLKIRILQHTVT